MQNLHIEPEAVKQNWKNTQRLMDKQGFWGDFSLLLHIFWNP